MAGNGEKWEDIPPPEARRRDGLKRVSTKTFWGKVPAARLAIEAGRVLALLEPASLVGNKNKALGKVWLHLQDLLKWAGDDSYAGAGERWRQMSWYDRMEEYMKPERSEFLAEQRRESEESIAAFKRAFECCGTVCSQRKRFKAGFSVEAGEDF